MAPIQETFIHETAKEETKMTVSCVICEGKITVPENVMIGEVVICGDCGSELEIVGLDPVILAEAPEIQEDWGE